MVSATGVRIGWAQLPAPVRQGVEELLGDRVVEAVSQPGGFSPGTADRVVTASGRRAFVKAVGPEPNPHSPDLHRREALVTAGLPPDAPAPALLGSWDDGSWVALVLEDVDGRQPVVPWRADELSAALDALAALAVVADPSPLPDLPSAEQALAEDFAGWVRLGEQPWDGLGAWARRHHDRLAALAAQAGGAVRGDALLHLDVRADNLLVTADGRVVLVDWPWACRGSAWVDSVLLLVNAVLYGDHDADALLGRRAVTAGADPEAVTAVLAGLAGFFLDAGRQPGSPGLPTVRAFQRAQGEATLRWLRRRTGWA